jgi:RNA polymerase sigma-70 factor (ECF subfamily)
VDDATLLQRARRGDTDAFSELFGRHQRAIYRYAVHMGGADAGDDVVQDTFLAVLGQSGRYEASRGTVGAYLLGVARHLLLKRLAIRVDLSLDDDSASVDRTIASDACSVLDTLTHAEMVQAVRAAVDSLPPSYREVIVLCELEELDYAEAAAIVECPIGTIRSRLHRARALLASKLAGARPVAGMRKG